MKKVAFLLLLAAASCAKHDPVADEVEVQTLGSDISCGFPAVVVIQNQDLVTRLIGTSFGNTYVVYNLDTALWQRKSQVLLLKIRQPTTSELRPCLAIGPGYRQFTVVSARVK